jgi:dephospho-CoA kinase
MPLIYINGISATGKSTILGVLSRKGYETHDTDEDGITAFYDNETGERVSAPNKISDRTEEWYDHHTLKISRKRIETFADNAKKRTVFLCGSTFSDTEVWDLFTKVVCLTIDEETLKHRLLTRTTNDWGKAPAEFEHVLLWREKWENINRERGAIMVDSTKPLEKVVDEIIKISKAT